MSVISRVDFHLSLGSGMPEDSSHLSSSGESPFFFPLCTICRIHSAVKKLREKGAAKFQKQRNFGGLLPLSEMTCRIMRIKSLLIKIELLHNTRSVRCLGEVGKVVPRHVSWQQSQLAAAGPWLIGNF